MATAASRDIKLPLEDRPDLLDESGPIFVFGCPRSGTTILADCLSALPTAVTQVGMLSPDRFMHLVGSGIVEPDVLEHLLWNQRYVFWRAFLESYLSRFLSFRDALRSRSFAVLSRRSRPVSELLFIYKEPFMGFAVHELARHFVRSKFIHIIRDGRDCADSMLRTYPDALTNDILRDPLLWRLKSSEIGVTRPWRGWYLPWWVEAGAEEAFVRAEPAMRYMWMWQAVVRRGLELRDVLGPDRLLEIRYEAFCAHPERTAKAMLRFLHVDGGRGFVRAIRRMSPRSVGVHHRWGEERAQGIERAGEPLLSELGYGRLTSAKPLRTAPKRDRRKLLIATQHLGIVGGVETYLRAVLPSIMAAGWEVGLLTEHSDTLDRVVGDYDKVPIWTCDTQPRELIAREIDAWQPQVLYAHGLGDPAFEAALVERFPTVLFGHNYHGTCVSGTKCFSNAHHQPCRRVIGPGCLAAYFPRGCGGSNPITMLELYRTQQLRHRTLDHYRTVLVASRHMADEFRRTGVTDDRLRVIPLFPTGAGPDPLPPSPRSRTDRVLFVGRINPLKGLRQLIAALPIAMAKLDRRLTLVVAGDGPDRAASATAARNAGVAARFLGWIGAEQRTEEMRAADILVVPSLWPEPFGLVGVEAGCVGLASVGFATGGIPEWLVPGVSGESAPGERPNANELAAALVRALESDSHLHRLRVGAWETARRFTAEAHVRELSETLDRAAEIR